MSVIEIVKVGTSGVKIITNGGKVDANMGSNYSYNINDLNGKVIAIKRRKDSREYLTIDLDEDDLTINGKNDFTTVSEVGEALDALFFLKGVEIHEGTTSPIGFVDGKGGDLYVRKSTGFSTLYIHSGPDDSVDNTSWSAMNKITAFASVGKTDVEVVTALTQGEWTDLDMVIDYVSGYEFNIVPESSGLAVSYTGVDVFEGRHVNVAVSCKKTAGGGQENIQFRFVDVAPNGDETVLGIPMIKSVKNTEYRTVPVFGLWQPMNGHILKVQVMNEEDNDDITVRTALLQIA